MSTAVATLNDTRIAVPADLQEKALLGGDLAKLSPQERLSYYNSVCTSLGLNPLTRPFEYIQLNGKLTLYARKDCTEQLRTNRHISVKILSREVVEGVYVVTAQASETIAHHERVDESVGAVSIEGLKGEARANAIMKAETKAKRRVTLSICGLGMLDETEVETIPGAQIVQETAAVVPPPTTPAQAAEPEPTAEPTGSAASSYILKIGRQKGKLIGEQADDNLEWALNFYLHKQQTEPASRYADEWAQAVMEIEQEQQRRGTFVFED